MKGLSGFAYAQTRLQSRYSQRADTDVWARLHNIQDLASYLHVAKQTPLRPWVLGISPTQSSHEIELLLRQKFRQHVDQVASWMPADWQNWLPWIKRLPDLPVLQYLLADGRALDWMRLDPDIAEFTVDDQTLRLQLMTAADCSSLVEARQQGETLVSGWLSHWKATQPQVIRFKKGINSVEHLLQQHMLQQSGQLQSKQNNDVLIANNEAWIDELRHLFRCYAFQPAAVCAYLAIIAFDLQHIRSDLIQRWMFPFHHEADITGGLPV